MFLKIFGNRSGIGKQDHVAILCVTFFCLWCLSFSIAAWGSTATYGDSKDKLTLESLASSPTEYPSVRIAEAAMRASRASLKETESLAGWSFNISFGVGEHAPLVVSPVTPTYFGSQFSIQLRYPILGSQAVQEENKAKARMDVVNQRAQIEESRGAALLALRRYYIDYWLAWNSARKARAWRLWLEAEKRSVNAERRQGFWSKVKVLQFRSEMEEARASETMFTQQAQAALAGIGGITGVKPMYLSPANPELCSPTKNNKLVKEEMLTNPRIISLKEKIKQLSKYKNNGFVQHLNGYLFIGGGNVYEPSLGRTGYQGTLGVEISGPIDFLQSDQAYRTKINATIAQVQLDLNEELIAQRAAVQRATASLAASEVSLRGIEAIRQAAKSAWYGIESQFEHGRGNILSSYIASRGQLYDTQKNYLIARANVWDNMAKLDYLVVYGLSSENGLYQ